jgi:hypothetical protein
LLHPPAAATAAAAIAAGDAKADDTQAAWVESMNAQPKVRHMMALMVTWDNSTARASEVRYDPVLEAV